MTHGSSWMLPSLPDYDDIGIYISITYQRIIKKPPMGFRQDNAEADKKD